jgi:Cu(I)/Ag(I) efflux system membrane fusion protein
MNTKLKYGFLLLGVILIGFSIYWFNLKSENHLESEHQNEVYTCSMHPEIIRDKPGDCPICGMFLVKKVRENHPVEDSSVGNLLKPTDNFIVGNFETTVPKDTVLSTEIKLPGIVAYDPNSSVSIAARISGRIERLYVNYKYQKVNKGQKLFDLYSPELLTEQQNFVYLISNDAENIAIIKASKQKLLLYGMTESQINSLVSTKRVNPILSIYSTASGVIQGTESMIIGGSSAMINTTTTENLSVKEGDYIKKNQTVFKLLNTDKVWGVFNVIQSYSSLIKIKQPIKISTEFDENEMINANINFIETQLNPADKTNRIRVYLNNSNLKLPIGLSLEGIVKTNPTKGIWIRKQAIVSLGIKKIVFKKMGNGFKATVLKTGIEIDDFMQVINGVSIHDTIAKNGSYLIDSESFVKTK